MQVFDMPYEILTLVMAQLSSSDVKSFAQCNTSLSNYVLQDKFWHDLCRLNHIHYRSPTTSWKELFSSGELKHMCPHISYNILQSVQQKKKLLWTQSSAMNNYALCLYPSCDYSGHSDSCHQHHVETKHPLVLKLSRAHVLDVWCNNCRKIIGFDYFTAELKPSITSERYIMHQLLQNITSCTSPISTDIDFLVLNGRRVIESRLMNSQPGRFGSYLIEKNWFCNWLNFISGKSQILPGPLSNSQLMRSDGTLDPTLCLGKDFELIGTSTRWYIERIYGFDPTFRIVSAEDIEYKSEYCKLVHKIKIRQQMAQTAFYTSLE